jgi:hypothetical protein
VRDASLDLQGRHPHLWSSSGLGLGSWNFSCRVPQFRIFYTTFFCERSPQRLCAVAGRDGTLGFDTMVWFPTVVYRHARRKTAKWPTELTGAATLASSRCHWDSAPSLVEFNLQIPVNSAIFFLFCSIAAAPPMLTRLRKAKRSRSERLLSTWTIAREPQATPKMTAKITQRDFTGRSILTSFAVAKV